MKYKVGDRTLLGEIKCIEEWNKGREYGIVSDNCYRWFSKSEIDKIVVKPKRNIDHLIELIEARKREEAVAFIDYDHERNAPWSNLTALLHPYIEPSKYPKLTPEELRAVKWLRDGGYESIVRDGCAYACYARVKASVLINPITNLLADSSWITSEPINLADLLAAQEDTP